MLSLAAALVATSFLQEIEERTVYDFPKERPLPVSLSTSEMRRGWQRGQMKHRGSMFGREIDFPEDSVLLLWNAVDVLDSESGIAVDVEFEPGSSTSTWIELGFEPTSLTFFRDEALIIAGKSPDGASVLKSWSFEWPACMPEPELEPREAEPLRPGGPRRKLSSLRLAPVVVSAPRELFRESLSLRGPILSMVPLADAHDSLPKVLVLFESTADLATIDLDTGRIELLASGSGHAGRFGHVSALASIRPNAIARLRAPDRLVYLIERQEQGLCGNVLNMRLALIDSDRDGSIDDHEAWDMIDRMLFTDGGAPFVLEWRAQLPPPPRK